MSYCDEHTCENCPARRPGGPCWEPESKDEEVQWSLDNELAMDLDMEMQELIDCVESDAAVKAEAMADYAYEMSHCNE